MKEGFEHLVRAIEREPVSKNLSVVAQETIAAIRELPGPERMRLAGRAREVFNRFGNRIILGSIYAAILVAGTTVGVEVKNDIDGTIEAHDKLRYSITEVEDPSGVIYEHQDPETTHLLNYMLGKEALSVADKLLAYRYAVKDRFNQDGKRLPANFDHLDARGLEQLLAGELATTGYDGAGAAQEAHAELGGYIDRKVIYDPKLYERVWKLERESGAPRVRWMDFEQAKRLQITERAYYDIKTNTAYINPEESFESYMAEDSHAYQFNTRYLHSEMEQDLDLPRMWLREWTKWESFRTAYDEAEYTTPGTIEYEAHREIEPRLWKEIGGHVPETR